MVERVTSPPLDDGRISVRTKLSALWAAMMFLYVYADILSLYKPGELDEIQRGMMGPFEATQGSLLLATILVAIPALAIIGSITLAPRWSRGVNIGLGAVYTLVNISNLIGETWAFYLTFGVLEIALTSIIIWTAWKWPAAEAAS